ncbi:MAG: nickel-dependent hydrogenase large subunit [Anaerosomatales bacterium]|nr:nickel-dependent hydrogenase large subunit [Anaerosomatales bacterium]
MTWDTTTMGGGMGVPAKAVHLRNLAVACDNLMSSITHFYHLAAPSYVQGPNMPPWTPYWNDADYHALLLSQGRTLPQVDEGFSKDLWSAVITQYVKALRMRRLVFEASALFIGRAPMTSNLVAGGVTVNAGDADFADRCDTFKEIMTEVGNFIAKEYVPVALALSALYPGYDNTNNLGLGWGAGLGNFLAWGNYPLPGGGIAVKGGKLDNTAAAPAFAHGAPDQFMTGYGSVDTAIQRVKVGLREFITYSRYADLDTPEFDADDKAYPGDVTRTVPDRDKASAYTYLKAPRFDEKAREVGPLARMYVNGIFQNDVALATTVNLGAPYVGYADYAKGAGLDPAMIAADIAVALVREGLATLTVDLSVDGGTAATIVVGKTVGVDGATHAIGTLTGAIITAAYTGGTVTVGLEEWAFSNPVITGTIAGHVLGLKAGISTMDRIRARALESLIHIQFVNGPADTWVGGWIADVKGMAGEATFIPKPTPTGERKGFGCIDAPRGALAHFSTINNGKISAYQCVVPYTWNGSPRDKFNNPGATEKALEGVPFDNNIPVYFGPGVAQVAGAESPAQAGGVEVLRVCQSFDPCIACAVH